MLRLSRVRALVVLLFAYGSVLAHAQQKDGPVPGRQEIAFDIPSQPLAAALSSYGAVTGMQVLYETSLAADKKSAAIEGKFTPEAALRMLLIGTGLVGRRTDVDAITIFAESREHRGNTSAVVPDEQFLGALQASILNTLCQNAETQPGTYRMALQLWITPTGVLQRAELLSSTGNTQRDKALAEQLRGLPIVAKPPPGMTQPVTLAIVPRSPLQRSECSSR
jgi:hypothetical protein